MISHYLICLHCGNSTAVPFVEASEEGDWQEESCESCGSNDLQVEDAD